MPLCLYAFTPLCLYAFTPLRLYAFAPLRLCAFPPQACCLSSLFRPLHIKKILFLYQYFETNNKSKAKSKEMSEKDKGFKFRRLFFRDAEPGKQEKQIQKTEPAIIKTLHTPVVVKDQSLVEDFVQRLQNLINKNNQPGFDFLEFTESLFEEKQNPDAEIYKTVFRIAQKIDKSLIPSRLVDSAMFYKDLVQRAADTEISKGVSKKRELQTEKDTERNNLDNGLKDTRTKIQQLTRQIQELQNQEADLNNQLLAIDHKYEGKFIDLERKIDAIRDAKEQVIVSIVDIEAGIKSNLK